MESLKILCRRSGFRFFPVALGRFGHEPLLYRFGRDADVLYLAIDHCLDTLKVGQETALHHLGDVHADTALFLGLTASADATPCDGTGSC